MNTQEIAAALEQQIKLQKQELARLEQALALINGDGPQILVAQPVKPKPVPAFATQKKRGKMPTRKNASQTLPWFAAPHAKPWTHQVYAFLANGSAKTLEEVLAYIQTIDKSVTRHQVHNCLVHMKQTGRLMFSNKKYRRKYFRGQKEEQVVESSKPELSLVTDNLPEPQRTEAVARLDALVEEGKLRKEFRAGRGIYLPV